jgi:hypothetical protein
MISNPNLQLFCQGVKFSISLVSNKRHRCAYKMSQTLHTSASVFMNKRMIKVTQICSFVVFNYLKLFQLFMSLHH